MALRVGGALLLALGLLGLMAVGGVAGESVVQGDTTDGVADERSASADPGVAGATAGAGFTVNITGANVPVAGEELEVVVGVENVGDGTATQTVELSVDGVGSNSTAVSLDSGESTETTMTVGTAAGDSGQYEAVVASENDTDTEPILVVSPPEFAVDIVNVTDSVEVGEEIAVTAEITNVGDVDDTQSVTLDIDGLGSASEAVSLPFGESVEETFTVATSEGDAGEYTATVASEDDSDSTTLVVGSSPEFAVNITGANVPVAGEDLEVVVGIENVGAGTATQTIELTVDGVGSNSTAVSLGSGESMETTMTVGTAADDSGQYEAVVASENDTDTEPILVVSPPEFAVDIVNVTDSVEVGEEIAVTAEITNVGDVDDTQSVTLDIDGLGSASEAVSLPFGESVEETFTVATSEGDAGEYTATVASEDDGASETVTVTGAGSPAFEIVNADMNDTLVEGETLSMTVEIENVGDAAGSKPVEAYAEGLDSETVTVELGAGESTEETLALDTDIGDTGEHTVYVETPDHGIEAPVEVHLPTMPGKTTPPADPDDDDQYEDIDGDDVFDIFDVQMFFTHIDHTMMDDHGWAFDFNNDGEVSILDVQTMFEDL
jgi:methionine-rich copper-binding protein CopC